jgi:phage terminase large subunit-like protein
MATGSPNNYGEPRRVSGDEVIAWVERYCCVPQGRFVEQQIRLAEFQKDFIRSIFDNPRGTRRAILSMARQNGKTFLAGALLLACICGPLAGETRSFIPAPCRWSKRRWCSTSWVK